MMKNEKTETSKWDVYCKATTDFEKARADFYKAKADYNKAKADYMRQQGDKTGVDHGNS